VPSAAEWLADPLKVTVVRIIGNKYRAGGGEELHIHFARHDGATKHCGYSDSRRRPPGRLTENIIINHVRRMKWE